MFFAISRFVDKHTEYAGPLDDNGAVTWTQTLALAKTFATGEAANQWAWEAEKGGYNMNVREIHIEPIQCQHRRNPTDRYEEFHINRCSNNAKVLEDGKWACGVHCKAATEKRKAANDAKYEARTKKVRTYFDRVNADHKFIEAVLRVYRGGEMPVVESLREQLVQLDEAHKAEGK